MKIRVVPIILTNGTTVVKGTEFNNWRTVGTVEAMAKLYSSRDVDELMFLDVRSTEKNREIPDSLLDCFNRELSVPFSVGGGIYKLDTASRYLNMGAEKIVLGSSLVENPKLITEIAQKFGSQAVVVSIDIVNYSKGYIAIHCGKTILTVNIKELIRQVQNLGAGEILLQSVSRDGGMAGMDISTILDVTSSVTLPVIASGGVGSLEDCANAVSSGASAIGISALFQFTQITPRMVRDYLASKGYKVRISN